LPPQPRADTRHHLRISPDDLLQAFGHRHGIVLVINTGGRFVIQSTWNGLCTSPIARGRQTRRSKKRIADTGPRAHAQLAGFERSFHRTGLIMVPNASRPIMIRKKTRDTKRKNAPRISASMLAHLLLFHRPFCFNCSDGVAVLARKLL
jgi:hypothetical protein